jgi:protein gp37
MALRLQAMGTSGYENGFTLSLHPNRLDDPLKRKKPTVYFVNSMSDLFHQKVPFSYIDKVFFNGLNTSKYRLMLSPIL